MPFFVMKARSHPSRPLLVGGRSKKKTINTTMNSLSCLFVFESYVFPSLEAAISSLFIQGVFIIGKPWLVCSSFGFSFEIGSFLNIQEKRELHLTPSLGQIYVPFLERMLLP